MALGPDAVYVMDMGKYLKSVNIVKVYSLFWKKVHLQVLMLVSPSTFSHTPWSSSMENEG